MAKKNSNLNNAKKAKNDEFYTQLADIERELVYYKNHFRGKTVLCNCDDPRISNFFRYFAYNFEHLGLKRLITTCYKNQDADLFGSHDSEQAVWLEYMGDKNDDKIPNPDEIGIHHFKGDGDFRSAECIELLKQADIVVTNPPFSLFREYVAQLIEYDKKFLIIGSKNAISYKEIFPLLKENKMWTGITGVKTFLKPRGETQTFGNIGWYTNLEHEKRNEEIILYKSYNYDEYPQYDNYNAIEVSKISDIPCDYYGVMGVPITFLDKYNPNQFEILGITDRGNVYGLTTKTYTSNDADNFSDLNRRAAYYTNVVNDTIGGGYNTQINSDLRKAFDQEEAIDNLIIAGFKKYDRPYIKGVRKYARILIRKIKK